MFRFSRSLIFIVLALVFLLSASRDAADRLRGFVASWLVFSPSNKDPDKLQKLELENLRLQVELERLRGEKPEEAVSARVVMRSPVSWNSSFWINVGEATNDHLGRIAIAKNSPVVVGTSVIGVVDHVGPKQSRVRLITDSGLTPSVRAARGGIQDKVLHSHLEALIRGLRQRPELSPLLEELSQKLYIENQTTLLAKGELRGSGMPLWRLAGQRLLGTGFNYDYADEEGPAHDLRSTPSILQVHDILITTGMDGIFPPGLQVAEVTRIKPLKEGDYFYELEAKPTAGSLEDLDLVFVLPPWR